MSEALTHALPTRRDEAWRYADIKAVETVWPAAQRVEDMRVAAGEHAQRALVLNGGEAQVTRLHIVLEEGARMELACLASAPQYGRVEVQVDVASHAHFELGGAILGAGEQTLEIVTEINHHAPDATSHQVVRNVLARQATGNFLGKIHIARDAQRIDAEQSVKSMLLERGASANAKPELEIFADDVKCAHGATVGELDKAALFYMASRGLDPQMAKRLMLQAFIADAFTDLVEGEARQSVEEAAQAALGALI